MLLVRGRHYSSGLLRDFEVADGLIQSISAPADGRQPSVGGEDCWVAPGLIDIQVNGFGGYSFLTDRVTPDDICAVAGLLAGAGVTAFCPTITTNSTAAIETAVRAVADACESNPSVRERVLGIHLEGPYISSLDGPRGAHPRHHVRPPDWAEFERWQATARGMIRLVTLAPELPGALDFIARARAAGLCVAIGHHAASREQIEAAVDAGATLSTHLGNGAHAVLPRHPNYVWEQLANDALVASVVVDGHHLPPSVVKAFFRAKGERRLVLVSDAIGLAGMAPGRYMVGGSEVILDDKGAARVAGTPYLAGSTLKLCDALNNLVAFAAATWPDAVRMATENPARLLGLAGERGVLRNTGRADLSIFRRTALGYKLVWTLAGGEICYAATML